MTGQFRCGYVTITGRPNVGKSTLLNSLLQHKLSITSRKPQTTRWRILGIKTGRNYQAVYVDTPGLTGKGQNALSRHMRREVINSLDRVDIIMFVIESLVWTDADEKVLELIRKQKSPLILVINKIDKIKNRRELLPFIDDISRKGSFMEIVPVSASNNINLDHLEKCVCSLLPLSEAQYPEDQLTDRNERFYASEFLREKLIDQLGDEIPYQLAVSVDNFRFVGKVLHIDAVIWVGKEGQKKIVIGKEGRVLKKAGISARKDMEVMFGHKVNLQTRVRVKKKWTDDLKATKQLGYNS